MIKYAHIISISHDRAQTDLEVMENFLPQPPELQVWATTPGSF